MIPSGRLCLQPYKLSNLLLVTLSLTLMHGNNKVPAFSIWYRRWTPVVVSSLMPTIRVAYFCQRVGSIAMVRLMMLRTHLNSALSVLDGSGRVPSLAKAFSALTPSWINKVISPPSSTIMSGPSPFPSSSGQVHAARVHSQYSSRLSPFHAYTAALWSRAMAAAAWSWVLKMLQLHQRISAPSSFKVSIKTPVWMVMCREPETRTPANGLDGPYSFLQFIKPGISYSAMSYSLRPKSAREMSATLYGAAP